MGLSIERFEQLLGGCDELAKVLIREHVTTLQRENAELLKDIETAAQDGNKDAAEISALEAKLAAAEAALKLARPEIEYKRTHGQTTQARKSARRAVDAVDAAIDAAKTGVKS